jgi:hypothetical protein
LSQLSERGAVDAAETAMANEQLAGDFEGIRRRRSTAEDNGDEFFIGEGLCPERLEPLTRTNRRRQIQDPRMICRRGLTQDRSSSRPGGPKRGQYNIGKSAAWT